LETLSEEADGHQDFVETYMARFKEMRTRLEGIKDRQKRLLYLHQVIMASNRVRRAAPRS
jgi:hypothetical protein